MLAHWVNSELGLEEAEGYSEECIRLWLHKCGFKVWCILYMSGYENLYNFTSQKVKETKKGCYVDGHEREDVVLDRQTRILPQMERILEECVVEQDENGKISIVNEDAEWILVSVDQKAHKSNERPIWWVKKEWQENFFND